MAPGRDRGPAGHGRKGEGWLLEVPVSQRPRLPGDRAPDWRDVLKSVIVQLFVVLPRSPDLGRRCREGLAHGAGAGLRPFQRAGTAATTSTSNIIPGRASCTTLSSVCGGRGLPANTSVRHVRISSRYRISVT